MVTSGWSTVGGQTQSAYVNGNVDPKNDKNPSGSSCGSAVGVSAGYAPFSIGTETDGSLFCPADRAALCSMKPTVGLVPQAEIVPVSNTFDTPGPMTRSVHDLATLLDVLTSRVPAKSHTLNMTGSWSDISVASLDPTVWKIPGVFIRPVESATEHTICTRRLNSMVQISSLN
ncbi:hypothetical protein MKZ38_004093 [Zalerion maritima]|uniref:Amidase domain-containing protein n=1 Tax=Zalerion maritima TaxID=339359 RepID=A0AAD5WWZ2_9PEZI|nr:hypothetical protein MKZ38_004093 [Zalerion maritima]